VVRCECIPKGQKVTQELSVTVLQHLQEALQRHDWNFGRNTAGFFTDNTVMHMVKSMQKFLAKDKIPVIPQLSYGPDLFPADFSSSRT
jgi:hypothetical protein